MKLLFFVAFLTTFISCKNSSGDKQIPIKSNRESVRQDIIGIWELLKENSGPTDQLSLVNPNNKKYLEIKADGTCQDAGYEARWFYPILTTSS